MKGLSTKVWIILFIVFGIGCYEAPVKVEREWVSLPPDTPFIMGQIEASPDTLLHYPEVVIGWVNSADHYMNHEPISDFFPLYKPTMLSSVVSLLNEYHLHYRPDGGASVIISGPLGHVDEERIQFTHMGNGVFVDEHHRLKSRSGASYKLEVTMSDGRIYESLTTLPEEFDVYFPDQFTMNSTLEFYATGEAKDVGMDVLRSSTYYPPKGAFIGVEQLNTNYDHLIFDTESIDDMPYSYAGNHTRQGARFNLIGNMRMGVVSDYRYLMDLVKREQVIYDAETYFRISFHNKDVGLYLYPLIHTVALQDTVSLRYIYNLTDRVELHDGNHLLSDSNIEFVRYDADSLHLGRGAIGNFSGSTAVYRTVQIQLNRTYNLDSLLQVIGI